MFTEVKVTEIYCLADDFCKYFDSIVEKYAIDTTNTIKRKYHRDNRLSKAEVMLIVIMFHASGFRCLKHFYLEYVCIRALMSISGKVLLRHRAIIETVNDELKNIAQVEHSRHRSFDNFVVNLLGGIAAYCFFPKKPCINIVKTIDNQLSLF